MENESTKFLGDLAWEGENEKRMRKNGLNTEPEFRYMSWLVCVRDIDRIRAHPKEEKVTPPNPCSLSPAVFLPARGDILLCSRSEGDSSSDMH